MRKRLSKTKFVDEFPVDCLKVLDYDITKANASVSVADKKKINQFSILSVIRVDAHLVMLCCLF